MVSDAAVERHSWISQRQFNDIDAQAEQFRGYGQEYQQLGPGPFQGRLSAFDFGDDLSINLERANRRLAQSASTPRGRFGACILADASPPCTLNGVTFGQEQVVVCAGSKSLEGITSEGMRIYCLDVSCELLPDDGCQMQRVGVLNDAARSRQLRDLLQSGLTAFTALDSLEDYGASVRGFKSSVVDALWQISAQTKGADFSPTTHYTSARTLRIFRRARDYIHHGLADGISIVALCKETGVSRRSMECVFRSVIGIGPANYIRVLQLNHIRRDLLSGADADVPIGMIAARHGMWHWSRFSRYYRLLFGELPSDTRTGQARCGVSGPPARTRRGTSRGLAAISG